MGITTPKNMTTITKWIGLLILCNVYALSDAQCLICDKDQGIKGKITSLTLTLLSTDNGVNTPVTMIGVDDHIVFNTNTFTSLGSTITLTSTTGKLRANTKLELSSSGTNSELEIHTSCSKPIYLDQQFVVPNLGIVSITGFNVVPKDSIDGKTGKTGGSSGSASKKSSKSGSTILFNQERTENDCSSNRLPGTTTSSTSTEQPQFRLVSNEEACDACGDDRTGEITMLRFKINAGMSAISNTQNGRASVSGTPMPTAAETPGGGCTGALLFLSDTSDLCTFSGLCNLETTGCVPWGADLTCTSADGSETYETATFEYGALNDFDGVTEPKESTAPYITDGSLVIVHNKGAPLANQVTCTMRSATDLCFGYSVGTTGAVVHTAGCADTVAESKGSLCACWPNDALSDLNPHLNFSQTISVNTGCDGGTNLTIGDSFGMFEFVGFLDDTGRSDVQCGSCISNPAVNDVCVGPRFDGSFDSSQTICHSEDTDLQVQTECRELVTSDDDGDDDDTQFRAPPDDPIGCIICGEEKGDKITALSFRWTSTSTSSTTISLDIDNLDANVFVVNSGDEIAAKLADDNDVLIQTNINLLTRSSSGTKALTSSSKKSKKVSRGKEARLASTGKSSKSSKKGGKSGSSGKFPANTDITINGETQTLHTSCSKPIAVGDTLTFSTGTLMITSFETTLGRTTGDCNSNRRLRRDLTRSFMDDVLIQSRSRRQQTTPTCQCGPKDPMFCLLNEAGSSCCSHYWLTCAISLWIQEYPQFNYLGLDEAYANMGVNVSDDTCELAQFNTNGNVDSIVPVLGLSCYSTDSLRRHSDIHSTSFRDTLNNFLGTSSALRSSQVKSRLYNSKSVLLVMISTSLAVIILAAFLAYRHRAHQVKMQQLEDRFEYVEIDDNGTISNASPSTTMVSVATKDIKPEPSIVSGEVENTPMEPFAVEELTPTKRRDISYKKHSPVAKSNDQTYLFSNTVKTYS
eukprot:m.32318 g.32318  ORF g.32318 m.32318 type:complete len:976 (-) comp8398_c0_seq1:2694-5621(-)